MLTPFLIVRKEGSQHFQKLQDVTRSHSQKTSFHSFYETEYIPFHHGNYASFGAGAGELSL